MLTDLKGKILSPGEQRYRNMRGKAGADQLPKRRHRATIKLASKFGRGGTT
jgi:hypothetical protein